MYSPRKSNIKAYNKTRDVIRKKPICRAPFSNLYFSKNGDVIACCFNRDFVIGNYPGDSLDEIWNGRRIKEFQKNIKDYVLPDGCEICSTEIKNENYFGVIARRMDVLKINKSYPYSMEFELDNTCNLECVMCEGIYSSSIRKNRERKEQIHSPYNDDFVDYITPFLGNVDIIRFGGGEPFLIDLYYKIWDKFLKINKNGTIFVQTNGTVINDRIRDYLKTGRFTLGVSVDSMDKKVFEGIRRNADFDKVIANILEFNELIPENSRYSRLLLSITLMRENWKDVPDVIEFANKLSLQIGLNTVWTPENHALFNLPADKLTEISDYYKKCHISNGNFWTFDYNKTVFYGIIKQIDAWIDSKKQKELELKSYSNLSENEIREIIIKKITNEQISNVMERKLFNVLEIIEKDNNYRNYLMLIVSSSVENIINTLEKADVNDIVKSLKNNIEGNSN